MWSVQALRPEYRIASTADLVCTTVGMKMILASAARGAAPALLTWFTWLAQMCATGVIPSRMPVRQAKSSNTVADR